MPTDEKKTPTKRPRRGLSRMALAAAEAARAAGEGELDELPLPAPGGGGPATAAANATEAEASPAGSEENDAAGLPDKLYYRIGEVAQLVGVDSHVLRYWESEFQMKPHRSASGQRLYRKEDLSQFLRIRHLLHDEGYTIAGARRVLAGDSSQAQAVDPAQVRAAITQIAELRARILEIRDELELDL